MTKQPAPKTINIRPFYDKGIVKLEIEHNPAGHDHLYVLNQEDEKIGYFHFDQDGFSFNPRPDNDSLVIHYHYNRGLI